MTTKLTAWWEVRNAAFSSSNGATERHSHTPQTRTRDNSAPLNIINYSHLTETRYFKTQSAFDTPSLFGCNSECTSGKRNEMLRD